MKKCTDCLIFKPLDKFTKKSSSPDGLRYDCKECNRLGGIQYRKTLVGLVNTIYSAQKVNSVKRGHIQPTYSRRELFSWVNTQENTIDLLNTWEESNFCTDLKPSIDRLDDSKPYSLTNIRLVTWKVNKLKDHKDKGIGLNRLLNGKVVGFYMSIREASRELNISRYKIGNHIDTNKTIEGYTYATNI